MVTEISTTIQDLLVKCAIKPTRYRVVVLTSLL